VRIHCFNDLTDWTAQWIFNDGFVQGYSNVVDHSHLVISKAAINNSGVYTCYGSYILGNRYDMFLASNTIDVIGKYN